MRTILYARVSTTEQTIAHQAAQARAEGQCRDDRSVDWRDSKTRAATS